MSSPEWNFSTYMAYFGQALTQESSNLGLTKEIKEQDTHYDDINNRNDIEEEKVFAELRPANRFGLVAGQPSNTGITSSSNPSNNEAVNSALSNANLSHDKAFNTTSISCIDSSFDDAFCEHETNLNFLENNAVCTEEIIEQQLLAWDPNTLTELGQIIFCDFETETESVTGLENDSQEQARHFIIRNGSTGFKTAGIAGLTEEDFKFPDSVEEQYKQMVLTSEDGKKVLPGIEAIFRPNSLQTQNNNNRPDQLNQLSGKEPVSCRPLIDTSSVVKRLLQNTNEASKLSITDARASEAKEIKADIEETKLDFPVGQASVNSAIENVETILSLINPAADIMGKTFHKIPSTQPIYSDNDARQSESEEENRVRRPMNAFMLWARKYR